MCQICAVRGAPLFFSSTPLTPLSPDSLHLAAAIRTSRGLWTTAVTGAPLGALGFLTSVAALRTTPPCRSRSALPRLPGAKGRCGQRLRLHHLRMTKAGPSGSIARPCSHAYHGWWKFEYFPEMSGSTHRTQINMPTWGKKWVGFWNHLQPTLPIGCSGAMSSSHINQQGGKRTPKSTSLGWGMGFWMFLVNIRFIPFQ